MSQALATRGNPTNEPHSLEPCDRHLSDAELIAAVKKQRRLFVLLPPPASAKPVPARKRSQSDWHEQRCADAALMETVRNSRLSHRSFTHPSRAAGIIGCS